ncbi:hypothetical protein FO519_003782 [Halicephalobus sp. NKZ332]|nr:hypothetical protein FO519_003782 [Halicephalobus sp. NKZ332]
MSVLLMGLVSGQFRNQPGPFDELRELTKDISPKARHAINELIAVDQMSDSAKRTTRLRRVMEKLDNETLKELFELYEKTTEESSNYDDSI